MQRCEPTQNGGAESTPPSTPIAPLDLAEIPALAHEVARLPLMVRYGANATGLADAWADALSRGDDMLVARLSGVASALSWVVPSGAFGRAAYLRLLAVCPWAQGKGLGADLLREAERRALRQSTHLFLLASDFNTRAHEFYRRLGYEQVGVIPGFVIPTVDEWIFSKHLAAEST